MSANKKTKTLHDIRCQCPHCLEDLSEKFITSLAGMIWRRKSAGRKPTTEEARAMQRKGVEARKRNDAKRKAQQEAVDYKYDERG